MSSIAPPPPVSASPKGSPAVRIRSDELIEARIAEACNALWWAELVRTVLGMVVFSIAALLVWIVVDQWIYSPGRLVRVVAACGLLSLLGVSIYRRLRPLIGGSIRPEYAARSLERDMPELRQALTSYVTLRGDREAGDLRSRVVKSIGATTAGRLRGHDALPQEATGTLRWWVATACALAVLVGYAAFSPKNTLQSAARLAAPMAAIDPPRRVSIREVQPGNAEAIAGRPVEVSATIAGLRNGEEAVCHWQLPSLQQEFTLIDDPDSSRRTGMLPLPHSASGDVRYTISAGDATAGPFLLTVQDVPVVALEAVQYSPPSYTGQLPYSSSSGAITAVDGTSVKILANTNRPIAKAKIEFNPRLLGNRMQATAGATEMEIDTAGTGLSVSFPLRSARGRSAAVEPEDYRILVWDASDQGNPDPIVYPIRVVPDLPPEVAITVPASSPKEVPIDAQQIIEVHASDPDFGLKSITLEIRAGIDLIDQPILWSSEAGEKGHRVAEFPLRPSELELRIGDTVQVVAIASDNRSSETDANVEPNVVRTDPVTLKITASGEVPRENDPNADGLTSPDERSAENDPSSGGSSGDSGKQQSGGGGSGSGSQQQAGGEGDGNSGGESEGNKSSEDSSGGGGAGGSNADSSDPNQTEPSESPDGANGSQSGGGQSGDASSGQSPSGQGDQGEQNESSESQPSDPSSGTGGRRDDAGSAGGQDSAGQSGQPQDAAASDPAGTGGANQNAGQAGESNDDAGSSGGQQQNQQGTGKGETGGESSAQSHSDPSQPQAAESGEGTSRSGSQSGAEGQQGSEPTRAPEHDGEAFERIQEYLDKNREGAERSQASGQDSGRPQDQQSGSGQQGTSGQKQDAGQGQRDSQGSQGQKGSQTEPSGQGEQKSGGDQGGQSEDAQGAAAGQESGGDQSSTADDSAQSGADQSGADGSDQPQQSGQPQSGQPQSSKSGDGSAGQSGKQDASAEKSDQGTGESKGDQEESAEPSDGQGNEKSGNEENTGGDSASSQSDSSQGSGNNSNASQGASPKGGQPGSSSAAAQPSSAGVGESGDQGDLAEQPPAPPDPVNAEYAKKATDLVLDYLEQTREAPDPKLLDELNWSKEDLQRFTERWQQVREMTEQPGAEGNRELEEAFKSLGLRPKGGAASTTRESADALKGIRDSGNRKPPPAAFRDAFDAFRRAVGQQQ